MCCENVRDLQSLVSDQNRLAARRQSAGLRRAGLYKQLAELQNVLAEFREEPSANAALKEPIVNLLQASGLQKDCPFRPAADGSGVVAEGGAAAVALTTENVAEVAPEAFEAYCSHLYLCAPCPRRSHGTRHQIPNGQGSLEILPVFLRVPS